MVQAQPRSLPCFTLKCVLHGQLFKLKGQCEAAKITKETFSHKKVIASLTKRKGKLLLLASEHSCVDGVPVD